MFVVQALSFVNGVYKFVGSCDGVGFYSNDIFEVYRGKENAWPLGFGYCDTEIDATSWIKSIVLYECQSEYPANHPPLSDWFVYRDIVSESAEPAPYVTVNVTENWGYHSLSSISYKVLQLSKNPCLSINSIVLFLLKTRNYKLR